MAVIGASVRVRVKVRVRVRLRVTVRDGFWLGRAPWR